MDIQKKIEEARNSSHYANYLLVRDAVLRMRNIPIEKIPEVAKPSDYWDEELSGFVYMFDASPLIIEKLRHHCYHLTGIHVYNYRTGAEKKQGPNFAEKLKALREFDHGDLFVPESPLLGGFGFSLDCGLANIDTLKFYECLLAMNRGGALAALRSGSERHVVVEIGAGWGGLAYTFKTLFPNICYVIIDFPELFLFSATYLMTLFPNARVTFMTNSASDVAGSWSDYDFIFVPNTLQDQFRPDRLDLAVNTVSFQEMTAEQVGAYVQLLAQLNCPIVYSLNRNRSHYATQLVNLHDILAEEYRLREIPMLPVSYTKMLDAAAKQKKKKKPKRPINFSDASVDNESSDQSEQFDDDDLAYKHVVGMKRFSR